MLGFHKDGLCIGTAIKLYELLIRPIFEFGAQIYTYHKKYMNKKRTIPMQSFKRLLGLRENVKNEVVRLLACVEPMNSRFSVLELRYFHVIRYHVIHQY